MFVVSQKAEAQAYPITDLLEANIGYKYQKQISRPYFMYLFQ